MSRLSPVSLAYFGKIATRGDFVRSTQQPALTRMLDLWLSEGLDLWSADPRWKQRYDQLGPCRFAFLGVRNRAALAGYLIPSVDLSGRRFPFVAAGSFEVDLPLPFMSQAPMALSRLWSRLETFSRAACGTDDAAGMLAKAADTRLQIDSTPRAHAVSFEDFLGLQTVGAMEGLLRTWHPQLELRRTLLALGLLLRPVLASGVSRLELGLVLPLPDDPLYAPYVGALWMHLVAPFLARGDFELALFVARSRTGVGPVLCIGFAGAAPATLRAILDVDKRDVAFVDVLSADWVDEHLDGDNSINKLSSYLMQSQLTMTQAVLTFKESFLGRM